MHPVFLFRMTAYTVVHITHGSPSFRARALMGNMEPRRKPLLALVPRDALQRKQSEHESSKSTAKARSPKRRHESHEQQQEPNDAKSDGQQEQQRLGERFLRVMALMSRLSHMNLSNSESLQPDSSRSISLSALEPALSPKRSPTGAASHAAVIGASAPLLVRVNAATEPLRQHLTADIVNLLPAPMDARQSPLQSPIRRQQLRHRGKRRRRRRRRRVPIEWHTSHTTWAPRVSADYIHEHGRRDFLGNCAGLVRKLAELKRSHGGSGVPKRSLAKSVSLPMLPNTRHSDASDRRRQPRPASLEQQDEEDEEEESASESESEPEDQEEQGTTQIEEAPPHPIPVAMDQDPVVQTQEDAPAPEHRAQQQPLFHQPAWISPELRRWLLQSRMFSQT